MVLEGNVSEILFADVIDFVFERFSPLIPIIQAIGIVTLIYLVYLIISGIYRLKDRKRLRRIEEKLDLLLNKKKSSRGKKKSSS